MSEKKCTVLAEGRGYFVLARRQELKSSFAPHPALRKIALEPVLDKERKETGRFKLEIDFMVDGNNASDDEVGNLARDLLDGILAMLAFSTGYPCSLTRTPSVRCPGTAKGAYRQLVFSELGPLGPFGTGTFGPPPVLNEVILGRALTDSQRLLLGWYKASLETTDYLESVTALLAALEPLANQFPFDAKRTEICSKCGNKRTLAPSAAQRVRSFLTGQGGLSTRDADAIWDMRNSLAHGRMARTARQRQEIAALRHALLSAVAKGLRTSLAMDHGGMPLAPVRGLTFSDAILAVDYKVPAEPGDTDT